MMTRSLFIASLILSSYFAWSQRLPYATNPSYRAQPSRLLVKLKVWNDSIICLTQDASHHLTDPNKLESLICSEMKRVAGPENKRHLVFLEVDSMTSFSVLDRVMEELEYLDRRSAVFFVRTAKGSSYGYDLAWRLSSTGRGEILAKLYGKKFKSGKSDCVKVKPDKSSKNIPPPPPPFMPLDPIEEYITAKSANTGPLPGFLGYKDGCYVLDGKTTPKDSLSDYMRKGTERTWFIRMGPESRYYELIRVIELLFATNCGKFLILSRSDQEYIKQKVKQN